MITIKIFIIMKVNTSYGSVTWDARAENCISVRMSSLAPKRMKFLPIFSAVLAIVPVKDEICYSSANGRCICT